MFLSDLSIRRPVFATMMMLALLVLGVVSYRRLAIDEYPDITYPIVVVQTTFPGASTEVMERDISKPIEEALNTVSGIRELTSTSLEGVSIVRLNLNIGVDVNAAQQDAQAKIARIRRKLPQNIDEPIVQHFDPNDNPIVSITVRSAERPIRELTDIADQQVTPRIEAVPGVGGVNLVGGHKRQIRIELNPVALRSMRISPAQVAAALAQENQEIPAGRVQRGQTEHLIRITGRVVDPRDFRDLPVIVRNGVAVRIRDLATVVDGEEDIRTAAEMNGVAAVSLDIVKVFGSNTVEVADGIRQAVADLQHQMPRDVNIDVIRDDSRRIRESLSDVQTTILLGAVLTIGIIYLFLNSWRSTVITGLTLPVSIISAFFVMWLFGFTINTMTLLALSLAIGLLIDDAIVVRENIVRHIEMGKNHHRAARDGTDEIGLAVVSTSLAVVAVFVPVAFMGGQIGRIFFQFGVTVTFAVLVSLFVSFTLDPMLSSVWSDPDVEHAGDVSGERGRRAAGRIRRLVTGFNDGFERIADHYPRWLDWALVHRWTVMGVAAASIVAAFAILPKLGFTWMPDVDGGEFSVNLITPPGSRLESTLDKGRQIATFLRAKPEVAFTYLTVGGGFRSTPNRGQIYVGLVPKAHRVRSQADIQTELRGFLRTIPGLRPSILGTPSIFSGYRQPVLVNVQGPEMTRLKIVADRVLRAMRNVPGVAEPFSSDEGDIPQLSVEVDRQQAWAAGVGVGSIGETLQPLFAGQKASTWEDPLGYSHDVVVVYPDSLRASASDVATIPVASEHVDSTIMQPSMVPLAQVAQVRASVGPQTIERRSLERQIQLAASVLPGYALGDVANAVQATVDTIGLPPAYHTVFTGDVQSLEETKGYVLEALILAVVFIYLILASLFGSFLQPAAIMLALPLSFIGVALALLITRGNLNVMTMIGIIMLMGLVTKNGILLVDFTNQERAAGRDRLNALLTAARIRLRPIIMTTVAMIFGMLPLALGVGAGAESRAPMARAVVGGLITSTLLTLFVVPVMYTLLDDATALVLRRRTVPEPTVEPAAGD
jgi:HAE1 family hydrophobic/amphiphilic exporter-1